MTDKSQSNQITKKSLAVLAYPIEWPTLGMITLCYGGYAAIMAGHFPLSAIFAIPVLAVLIALHSSLQHEVIHGHPFRKQWMSDLLVVFPIGLLVPYSRFKDTHLAHHRDPNLTDPYDDPESNFWCPETWDRLPEFFKRILKWNNTLCGRMLIGPVVGQLCFMTTDLIAISNGNFRVLKSWLAHLALALLLLFWIAAFSPVPIWAYLVSAYLGMSLLKVRTFLEHQAHEKYLHRSVIIEDKGFFSVLFLNNNYHLVHHLKPNVAWYLLPAQYRLNREGYNNKNGGYRFSSYWDVFRSYFLRQKDPVPHPNSKGQGKGQNA